MISIGIDVSKRKSTVAIINVMGEILHTPFDIDPSQNGIQNLLHLIKDYPKEQVRFIMEATGIYHLGLVNELQKQGYFVHVANPLLIKKYFDAEIRKGKTDRKDALKLSRYGTEKWWLLQEHSKADQIYQDLQFLSREYNSFMANKIKLKVQLSNLIERSFPGLEKILKGHYFGLLLDFYELYPCASVVREVSEKRFLNQFIRMAIKKGHRKGAQIAQKVYRLAHECVTFEPSHKVAGLSVKHCVSLLRSTEQATDSIITQMDELAKELPEYEIVKRMKGVGDKLAPRLIAEIGDVRRFKNSKSLIAYAGIDAPPYQSGQFEGTNRHISKRGSRSLRKCGYEVMMAIKSSKPKEDNAVYEYMLKKEAEGKNKKLVKIAGLNKFLRIYYARVMEVYQA
ncbi:Transposase IS116/IS110/IS902 family [Turicibacter sanguinis]|nr:Transposase IS116/IS110/IS902 family [Turicibacter sanguinis]